MPRKVETESNLIKISAQVDKDEWKAFKNLPAPEGAHHSGAASWHLREAMRLYRQVIKTELKHSVKIIEKIS